MEVAEAVAWPQGREADLPVRRPGLLGEDDRLVESVTADEARAGRDGRGLTEDLHLFCRAIRAVRGVARCHLIDHDIDGGLLLEFFTHAGVARWCRATRCSACARPR